MRLLKFIFSTIIVTSIALLYVHQQVELVKVSYDISSKEVRLERMLDRKESLGYNVKTLESPSRLEQVLLAKKIDVAFPKRGHVVMAVNPVALPAIRESLRSASLERPNIFFGILEFLGLAKEVQAKER